MIFAEMGSAQTVLYLAVPKNEGRLVSAGNIVVRGVKIVCYALQALILLDLMLRRQTFGHLLISKAEQHEFKVFS